MKCCKTQTCVAILVAVLSFLLWFRSHSPGDAGWNPCTFRKTFLRDRTCLQDLEWNKFWTDLFMPDGTAQYWWFFAASETYKLQGHTPDCRLFSVNFYPNPTESKVFPSTQLIDYQLNVEDDGSWVFYIAPDANSEVNIPADNKNPVVHVGAKPFICMLRCYVSANPGEEWTAHGMPSIDLLSQPLDNELHQHTPAGALGLVGYWPARIGALFIYYFKMPFKDYIYTKPLQDNGYLPITTIENQEFFFFRYDGDFVFPALDHNYVQTFTPLMKDAVTMFRIIPPPIVGKNWEKEGSHARYYSLMFYLPDSTYWMGLHDEKMKIQSDGSAVVAVGPYMASDELNAKLKKQTEEIGAKHFEDQIVYLENDIPWYGEYMGPLVVSLRMIYPEDFSEYSHKRSSPIYFGHEGQTQKWFQKQFDMQNHMGDLAASGYMYTIDEWMQA